MRFLALYLKILHGYFSGKISLYPLKSNLFIFGRNLSTSRLEYFCMEISCCKFSANLLAFDRWCFELKTSALLSHWDTQIENHKQAQLIYWKIVRKGKHGFTQKKDFLSFIFEKQNRDKLCLIWFFKPLA